MTYLLAFAVLFLTTGLKVVQQRNVEDDRRLLIPPLSMVMQVVECITWGVGVHAYATGNWLTIAVMGLGAGSGSLFAMWVDRRYLRRPKPLQTPVVALRRVK